MSEATLAQDCACSLDYGYHSEVYSRRWRTARKPNECCECGDPIKPGERYEYVWGKCEGDWYTAVTCETCVKIWDDFFPMCVRLHGGLAEEFQECYGFDYRYPAGSVDAEAGGAEGAE